MPLLRSRYGEEKVVDGGLEAWTSDTDLTSWEESGVSAGVRDITKETVEKHGGSYAAKLEATNNNGTIFTINQTLILAANKYYKVQWWSYFASRTLGRVQLKFWNPTDGLLVWFDRISIDAAYIKRVKVCKPTVITSYIYASLSDETTTGIVYFDDISVRLIYPQRRGS